MLKPERVDKYITIPHQSEHGVCRFFLQNLFSFLSETYGRSRTTKRRTYAAGKEAYVTIRSTNGVIMKRTYY